MPTLFKKFINDTRGATAIEYGVLAVLIAVGLSFAAPIVSAQFQGGLEVIEEATNPQQKSTSSDTAASQDTSNWKLRD